MTLVNTHTHTQRQNSLKTRCTYKRPIRQPPASDFNSSTYLGNLRRHTSQMQLECITVPSHHQDLGVEASSFQDFVIWGTPHRRASGTASRHSHNASHCYASSYRVMAVGLLLPPTAHDHPHSRVVMAVGLQVIGF